MTPVTYENLITTRPFFFSKILGGWAGKINFCMDIALNELPKKYYSLLLISYSDEHIPLIESSLKDIYTSGIIIFAKKEEYIPSPIIDLADTYKKPLLFLTDYEEDFLYEKLKQILQLHSNHLLSLLKSDLTTYWLHLFYQTSIQRVMQRLNTLMGEEIYYFTNKKRFFPISSSDSPIHELSQLKEVKECSTHSNSQISQGYSGDQEYYLYSIFDNDHNVIGYFLFKKTQQLTNARIHMLESTSTAMITWQTQMKLTRDIHIKYKDQLLFDILNNNIETESDLIELGKMWDMKFSPNACVLVINLNSSQAITKEIYLNIQNLLLETNTLSIHVHTTYLSHRVVALLIPTEGKKIFKDDIVKWLLNVREEISQSYPKIETIIGIGRSYHSNLNIYKSFQEAKIALQMYDYVLATQGIIHYEDIGFVRLLSYIHDDLLDDFSEQYLGKLEKYDKENETDYVQTLYTYCQYNGDIMNSADKLYIHPNTLRQRLKKIETILNIQLNHYPDLVNIILALKVSKDMNI